MILTFIWKWHSLFSQLVFHSTAPGKAQCLSLKLRGAARRCPVQGDLAARWRSSARRGSRWRSILRACGESRVWRSCRAACARRGSPEPWPQRRAPAASPPCAAAPPRSPASASPSGSHTARTAASPAAVWTEGPPSLGKVNDSQWQAVTELHVSLLQGDTVEKHVQFDVVLHLQHGSVTSFWWPLSRYSHTKIYSDTFNISHIFTVYSL